MYANGVDTRVWLQSAWRNRLQSALLLLVLAGFLGLLGWLLWGWEGVLAALVVGVVAVAFNPVLSPMLVMRLYRATPIHPRQAGPLWPAVAEISERAGLPAPPVLYYIPSGMLNAMAVGTPRASVVALTDGLLRQLDMREIVGVLAHEISHIRNNDLWVMGLADLLSRTTSLLSLMGQFLLLLNLPLILFGAVTVNWVAIFLMVFAPSLSALAQLALSRTREFDADLNAVGLTGDPDGLASALLKIEQVQGGVWERILMPGRRIPEPSLLRTHPETRERIVRLMSVKPSLPRVPRVGGAATDGDALSALAGPVRRSPRWHVTGLWH